MNAAARLHAQGLGKPRTRDAHGAVHTAFAIQAQDTRGARLGVRARSEGLTAADVVRACSEQRALVRTWAMRGTLHMLCAEDVRWVTGLLGPVVLRRSARRRAALGLDPGVCDRIVAALPAVLADGPLVRAEMMDALVARGLPIDVDGQAAAHAVAMACARGVTCRGPDRPDEEPTYVLLDDWVGAEPPREGDAAAAELARRFRAAYGPSDVHDFAYWSGLPMAGARAAWTRAGEPVWPARPEAPPPARLLPAFDGCLLGHRDRAPLVRAVDAGRLTSGTWIRPSAVAAGRVVGTWSRAARDGVEVVTLAPFATLPRGARTALRAEAEDIGRFLGIPGRLEIATA